MTRPPAVALLATLAVLALLRSFSRPSLRRPALALALLASTATARLWSHEHAPRTDVALSMAWPAVTAWFLSGAWPGLAVVAYALALSRWGWHLREHWTLALAAPRVAVGALASVIAWKRRPFTPTQRVGLLLSACQLAGVVSAAILGDAYTWDDMRVISAFVYLWIGLTVLREEKPCIE